ARPLIAAFTASGASAPAAFLSGANSSCRVVSTRTQRSASGSTSKMKRSNLRAFSFSGWTALPASSRCGTFLRATWKGVRPAAPLPQPVEQAGVGQGGQGAAVPVGAEEEPAGRLQQELPARQVEGRHRPLPEEDHLAGVQPEVLVPGEEVGRFRVGGRARH